ncbi:MAG: helix-turn-helix domain-containing protein [Defluviitaleaceae bacterium]|nr:helix-turn-helix domain-containing protein [Defluviitaleaceae bacterium]
MYINIEIERVRRRLTKSTLARRLCIDATVLDDWVYRRSAIPAQKLYALLEIFNGCSADYLLKERR